MKTVRIEKVTLWLLICKSANTNCKANRERNRIVDNTKRMPKDKIKPNQKTKKKRNSCHISKCTYLYIKYLLIKHKKTTAN